MQSGSFCYKHCNIFEGIFVNRTQRSGWHTRRYFDFVNFNSTGFRPYVTTFYAVLLGSLRKTLSRILVLIVSMGFGVLLPYLGAIQKKVTPIHVTLYKITEDICYCDNRTPSTLIRLSALTAACLNERAKFEPPQVVKSYSQRADHCLGCDLLHCCGVPGYDLQRGHNRRPDQRGQDHFDPAGRSPGWAFHSLGVHQPLPHLEPGPGQKSWCKAGSVQARS